MSVIRCLKVEKNKEPKVINIVYGKEGFFYEVRKEISAAYIKDVHVGFEGDLSVSLLLDETGKFANKECSRDFSYWGSSDYVAGPFLVVTGDLKVGKYVSLIESMIKHWSSVWALK